jgi:hypothetical protein
MRSISQTRPLRCTGKQGFGLRRDGALDQVDIHVVSPRPHVDQHRVRAAMNDGGHRRDERMGHGDDLVARPDAGAEQGEQQRMVAAVDADGIFHADEFGQVLLEILELVPIDQIAVRQAPRDRAVNLRLKFRVVTARIDERNLIRHKNSLAP